MKTAAKTTQNSPHRGFVHRMMAMLLVVVTMTGMLVIPTSAASTERASVAVGGTKYLSDNSSYSLAGATVVKNSWIWESSNSYVAGIITNNAPSCQIKGMAVGTAIISCTTYVTIYRTNPITKRMEQSYGSMMGSIYEVTVTASGSNTSNSNGGGSSTYMKTNPENLRFDLAAYSEKRVSLEISSRAPSNYPEFQSSTYVTVRKSQSTSSIYKYTLTIGLTSGTPVGNYTAEAVLKNSSGTIRDRLSIPINVICSHGYNSWTITKEATCLETGQKTRSCKYCGDIWTETIPIAEHDVGTEWLSNGAQHWKECASCGEKSDAASHEWDDGSITRQPDYNREGVKTYTCTVCGATKAESIPKLACQTHSYDSGKVTTQATSSREGVKTYTCTVCGAAKTESIPRLACQTHSYDSGKVTTQATSSREGVKTYTCTVCGAAKTESIPRTNDTGASQTSGKSVPRTSFPSMSLSGVRGKSTRNSLNTNSTGRVSYVSSDPSVAKVSSTGYVSFLKAGTATITATVAETSNYQTAKASYTVTVTDPGNTGNTDRSGARTAAQKDCRGRHSYDQGVIRRDPTCSTGGETVYTCLVCGYTRTRPISPTFDHNYDKGVVTQQPVGWRSGRITYTCVDCGRTRTKLVSN